MLATLYAMPGDYDDQLFWPAKATITLELVNVKGGENVRAEHTITWKKPVGAIEHMVVVRGTTYKGYHVFLPLSDIGNYLHNDSLQFIINIR